MRQMLRLGLILAIVSSTARGGEPDALLPEVAEGWSIELVAHAPILYPTAVVAAPDGTIYLGQDPMDMPGPPTEPIDSIVAIRGGEVSTFAEGLWSVMGLEWVDGTLFVVHAPFLSALRDIDGDGRADVRVDLVRGLGPELPGFNGINDHVASGVRLGMDGYLYVSVGDKGLPKARGRDGASVQLFGGGVVRVRPDGTGLEVVSTGERNPLSVALTAADEIFTYGNDDDSKRWPNSLTHHVVGGHYGYPYQFLDAPGRCLPVVAGEVGGSGAQGLCYEEDGLPARYRGNLFFCDWGLQRVDRFEVERSGGTFTLGRREPLVEKAGLDDFRPFSMAILPDGTGFILVDWGYNSWLAKGPQSGRLYRLTYTGPDAVRPAPRPTSDDPAARLDSLDHPARSVRLESQRILSRLGAPAIGPLAVRLRTAGNLDGRRHAIWALDAIGTPEARGAIRGALADAEPEVRLQAARSVGIRRDRVARADLARRLVDPEASVRREAAIALGRLGDRAAGPALYKALGDPDTVVDWSVRHAIRSLGAWDVPALAAALLDPDRRESALRLTDESWAVPVVEALMVALRSTDDPSARARIVANLAGLYRTYPAWSGHWFGTNPLVGTRPRKTQDWDRVGMARVLDGLTLGLADPDSDVRSRAISGLAEVGLASLPSLQARLEVETNPANLAAIAGALGSMEDPSSVPALAALAVDAARPFEVRAAALDALGTFRDRKAMVARLSLVFDKAAPAELVARAILDVGRVGILPPNDLAGFLDHEAAPIRVAALWALGVAGRVPPDVGRALIARLDDPEPAARKAALAASANLNLREAIPRLLELADEDGYRSEATLALAALPDPRASTIYLGALGDRSPQLRRAGESALLAIRDLVAVDLEARARSGRLDGPAALAVERILTRFRPIVDWRAIGPFPRTTAKVFLGEPSIDFDEAHVGAGGRTIAWAARRADRETGRVVIDDLKGGAGDRGGFGYDTNGSPNLAAFAFAEIESDRDRPALLLVGSSGSLVVSLNERIVHNYHDNAGRPYHPDSGRIRVNLVRGTNRLLIQSRQGIGAWSFGVQISEPGESLFATAPGAFGLDQLRAFALAHEGEPARGEAIFFESGGIGCVKCHAAGGHGEGDIGPDLAGLGLKYDKEEIVRSVLEPSNRIVTGYQPVLVATNDGQVFAGLVRGESAEFLDLVDADGKSTRLRQSEISERRVGDVSIMPAGLVDTLTPPEFADLIAYLQSLRSAPAAVEDSTAP